MNGVSVVVVRSGRIFRGGAEKRRGNGRILEKEENLKGRGLERKMGEVTIWRNNIRN